MISRRLPWHWGKLPGPDVTLLAEALLCINNFIGFAALVAGRSCTADHRIKQIRFLDHSFERTCAEACEANFEIEG